jgi:hypothetical protein
MRLYVKMVVVVADAHDQSVSEHGCKHSGQRPLVLGVKSCVHLIQEVQRRGRRG